MNTNQYLYGRGTRTLFDHIVSRMISLCVHAAAAMTVMVLGFLIAYIMVRGIPNLKPSLFSWEYMMRKKLMMSKRKDR